MKKVFRKIEKVFSLTFGLPFILIMALGYWSHSDKTYLESVKELLK